jgi:hypothetical protein
VETALFASLLKRAGQSEIDEFLKELEVNNIFTERANYLRVKKNLHTISSTVEFSEKDDLMKEVEVQIFNMARHSR